jgi:hypothetical protein
MMLDPEFLKKVAEGVILKEEERAHLEETGAVLIHYDFEILKVGDAILSAGRSGDYYKFSFEYELSFLDDQHLREKENEVRNYKRSLRLSPEGNVVGIGDRVELLD